MTKGDPKGDPKGGPKGGPNRRVAPRLPRRGNGARDKDPDVIFPAGEPCATHEGLSVSLSLRCVRSKVAPPM